VGFVGFELAPRRLLMMSPNFMGGDFFVHKPSPYRNGSLLDEKILLFHKYKAFAQVEKKQVEAKIQNN
jgi:hypothetical protein